MSDLRLQIEQQKTTLHKIWLNATSSGVDFDLDIENSERFQS